MHDIFNKEINELTGEVVSKDASPNRKNSPKNQNTKTVHEEYLENLTLAEEGKEIINFIGAINLIMLMAIFFFVIERVI